MHALAHWLHDEAAAAQLWCLCASQRGVHVEIELLLLCARRLSQVQREAARVEEKIFA